MAIPAAGEQDHVDTLLRRGIIFSVLWLAGFGSAVALINGWRARRLIRASGGVLRGRGRVWWCLVVGGLGVLFWAPVVIANVVNQF